MPWDRWRKRKAFRLYVSVRVFLECHRQRRPSNKTDIRRAFRQCVFLCVSVASYGFQKFFRILCTGTFDLPVLYYANDDD